MGLKSEQQAFAARGLDFVTKEYLPARLSEMGIIRAGGSLVKESGCLLSWQNNCLIRTPKIMISLSLVPAHLHEEPEGEPGNQEHDY